MRKITQLLVEWQSCPIFNFGSPSSRKGSVRRIEREFLGAGAHPRVLDVGGTKAGFSKRAAPQIRKCITIVNPAESLAAFGKLHEVPETPAYDLIMMFGVLNELTPDYDMKSNFRDARARLAPDGIFLVAEPSHRKIGEYDCFRALVEVGFELDKITKRIDLRPGFSLTKYFVFTARA